MTARALQYVTEIRPDVYTDGRPCYVAQHPELPGCFAYADTVQEAERMLAAARALYLKNLADAGEPIPAPRPRPVARFVRWQLGPAERQNAPERWAPSASESLLETVA